MTRHQSILIFSCIFASQWSLIFSRWPNQLFRFLTTTSGSNFRLSTKRNGKEWPNRWLIRRKLGIKRSIIRSRWSIVTSAAKIIWSVVDRAIGTMWVTYTIKLLKESDLNSQRVKPNTHTTSNMCFFCTSSLSTHHMRSFKSCYIYIIFFFLSLVPSFFLLFSTARCLTK